MVGTARCAFAHPTDLTAVMPGLVPGIHVFTVHDIRRRGWLGHPVKTRFALSSGHDEETK
ncbi:hypothetical protein SAMN05444050_2829 [Afipia sp. GAS231]|nr:hypothetical protein SAMN05444050_2829 [Afipia sp. GAS231]